MKNETQSQGQQIAGRYRTADGKAMIEWELEPKEKGFEFSASGQYDGGAGQCLEDIARAYPEDPQIARIVKVWRAYHLNGMRAGCEHQRAAQWGKEELTLVSYASPKLESGKNYPSISTVETQLKGWVESNRFRPRGEVRAGRVNLGNWDNLPFDSYLSSLSTIWSNHVAKPAKANDPRVIWFAATFGCERKEEKKLANWVRPDEHPEGVLCKPCPVCGYAYGSQWLFEIIPDDVIQEIKSWSSFAREDSRTLGECNADEFLERNGLTMRITLSDTKPASWTPAGHHYRITVTGKGRPRLVFDFWGSASDAENKVDPSSYDILSCVASDIHTPDTWEDYCSEYGEDSDSIKARQTFRRAASFAQRLRAFFTSDEITELESIQ